MSTMPTDDEKAADPLAFLGSLPYEATLPRVSEIMGCELHLTCSACPEQYDVMHQGKQIGYLRLRHGVFRADYLDCGGDTVYCAYPNGDGIFESDERQRYLKEAVAILINRYYYDLNQAAGKEAPDPFADLAADPVDRRGSQ